MLIDNGCNFCPVCGEWVYKIGETKDGRIILKCKDAVKASKFYEQEEAK